MIAKSDINNSSWDTSQFPIVCDKCLGSSKFLRMTKADFDSQCKICKRPFTVFTWKSDSNSRYKKTEICQICAKLKNVCQTCLFDLQFGLPVEVRDKYLTKKVELPTEIANREFFIESVIKNVDKLDLPYYKKDAYPKIKEILDVKHSLKKNEEGYSTSNRNLPHICSFFLKGLCTRGDACPYRHEIPDISFDNNESKNNFKERFIGLQDPYAKKILEEYNDSKVPDPPKDKNITTLYIPGLTDTSIKEKDLLKIFSKFGYVKKIRLLIDNFSAFVTFTRREDAEKCMQKLYNKLVINLDKYRLIWAKTNDINNDNSTLKDAYKTECPLYDKDKNVNNIVKTSENEDLNQKITTINLICYDNGDIPYYASIDKNLQGGNLLKKKRKKVIEDY